GLFGFGAAPVHGQRAFGDDEVGGVQAGEVIGAQGGLPPDQQQRRVAGIGQGLLRPSGASSAVRSAGRSAVRRRAGVTVGCRRIPARTCPTISCHAGFSVDMPMAAFAAPVSLVATPTARPVATGADVDVVMAALWPVWWATEMAAR